MISYIFYCVSTFKILLSFGNSNVIADYQLITIENNDKVQPHFAQVHVTEFFLSYCKYLMPKLFFKCMSRCAKVRFWRFLDFYIMKINLWSKFDNSASL